MVSLRTRDGSSRQDLVRQAFRLEYITLAWMVVEALVALAAGLAAHSLTLVAFGADSVIELLSALVLVWRLNVELRHGATFAETAERRAARIAGGLLFALAAYVVLSAAWKVWSRQGAEFSAPGLALALVAIPLMYVLARWKLEVAEKLSSRALRADAIESMTCGWLSLVVVVALVFQVVFGVWWIDAVASLGVVWFLVREGREAFFDDESEDLE